MGGKGDGWVGNWRISRETHCLFLSQLPVLYSISHTQNPMAVVSAIEQSEFGQFHHSQILYTFSVGAGHCNHFFPPWSLTIQVLDVY